MAQKRIFISYRRSDSGGHAGRLYDYLKNYFGNERIFFDVDTIKPGTNFEKKINDELDNSEAALVLIGNQWLESRDNEGNRRLDYPHDYVRFEVETALGKNITVIPILLQGTQMPSGNVLPDTLYDLSRRNAIKLNDDHWNSDCNLLADTLKNALGVSGSLKKQKFRRYRLIVVLLAILASIMAILTQIVPREWSPPMIGLARGLLLVSCISNALVITYLLGNIKEELDRLSWVIITIAILGTILSAFDGTVILAAVAMVLLAGLFNFIEPDE